MNLLGLLIIATAVIFLIYSIINKNKVSISFSDIYIILYEERFLSLQLYCSILNSACMIIFGIIIIKYKLNSPYITLYPLLFHFINYTKIPIGRVKHYIKYK